MSQTIEFTAESSPAFRPSTEANYTITAEVDLGRPAPPCRNPSDPNYSDPGEGSSAELVGVVDEDDQNILTNLSKDELEFLEYIAIEKAAELDFERKYGGE